MFGVLFHGADSAGYCITAYYVHVPRYSVAPAGSVTKLRHRQTDVLALQLTWIHWYVSSSGGSSLRGFPYMLILFPMITPMLICLFCLPGMGS
jgi:hypothetical protein